jgi:predicted transcriptional regulator
MFDISLKNMSRYKNGSRSMSLDLFNKIILSFNTDIIKLQNKIDIKIGKTGKYLKIGPIIEINEDWIYVSELIKGDGHIPSNFWTITFVNKDMILINFLISFFRSLGLDEKHIYLKKREDANFLIIHSSLLAILFHKILDVPIGKKKEISINDFVIKDRLLAISAVRGIFDAEGCASNTGTKRLSITSNSKNWLEQVKNILANLKIKSILYKENRENGPIYRLFIYHIINIKRFYDIIRPLQTKRNKKMIEIIESYSGNPIGAFHKKILESIKRGNNKRVEMAEDLNLTKSAVGNNLMWLTRNELINAIEKCYTNKGSFYRYGLTERGLKYLEGELELDPFFD